MEWEGEPALLVSLRDVTDRQEAERQRRELMREQAARGRAEAEERRFRFLAEASAVLDSSLDYRAVLSRLARLVVSPDSSPWAAERPSTAPSRLADLCVIDVVEPDGTIERIAVAHHDESKAPLLERLREEFPPRWQETNPALAALRSREPVLHPSVGEAQLAELTRSPEHAALLRDWAFPPYRRPAGRPRQDARRRHPRLHRQRLLRGGVRPRAGPRAALGALHLQRPSLPRGAGGQPRQVATSSP